MEHQATPCKKAEFHPSNKARETPTKMRANRFIEKLRSQTDTTFANWSISFVKALSGLTGGYLYRILYR